jgi:hypothetical protein
MALAEIDANSVRRWTSACVHALERHRGAIDAINVYPVADGDTGTNLLHTVRAGFDELMRAEPVTAADALRRLAAGALTGARGNSGVIVSQVLRGFADATKTQLGATELHGAIAAAAKLAGQAVSEPAPGTMLTVLDAMAAVPASDKLVELLGNLVAVGEEALRSTRTQLDALTRAGVVDAGAHGMLLLFAELHNIVAERVEVELALPGPGRVAALARQADALLTEREGGSELYQYEVMYLLDAPGGQDALVTALRELGDCVSVAGDGAGLWTVHVHCNDIGAAMEAGIVAGRPHRITVARFADQVQVPARFATDRSVVTFARGDGVARLFRSEGAAVLVLSAESEPTGSDVLAVIVGSRAATVTVLSNEPELAEVIEAGAAAARHAGQSVTVIPTMSPVQGLAALAVHDATRRAEDDVVAMAEAAAATRRGALVIAVEEALTWAGRCVPGDVLGMIDGEVAFISRDVAAAASDLVGRMLDYGGELVTVLLGAQAEQELAAVIEQRAHDDHPEVDIAVYAGDQHDAVVVLGVE